MNTAARISAVLVFIIGELIDALLRPLWLTDRSAFTELLNATDCYPFRVCYVIGQTSQFWLEAPGTESTEEDYS